MLWSFAYLVVRNLFALVWLWRGRVAVRAFPIDAGYLRFVERRLREEYGFTGTPIELEQRPRERRRR